MSVQLTTIAPGSQAQAGQIDERLKNFNRLVEITPARVRDEFNRRLMLSWVHHDSAMEGTVYSSDELVAAVRGDAPPDPSLVPVYDEIRQNKAAIELCYELAKKKLKIDADVVRDLYICLAPDEVEGKKPPAFRKDMPLHRLYLHEIATPDKIAPKLKQFSDWFNSPETRKSTHTVRLAAKAHYYLLQIYPYPKHSGKVARLVMNLVLLNGGYTPAIIHATERQRYYDALKTNENSVSQIVRESLIASIDSGIRYFEMFAPPPPPPDPKKRKRVDIGRSAKAKRAELNPTAARASKASSPGLRLAPSLGKTSKWTPTKPIPARSSAPKSVLPAPKSIPPKSLTSPAPSALSPKALPGKSVPPKANAVPLKAPPPAVKSPSKSVTPGAKSAKAAAKTSVKPVSKASVKPAKKPSKR